MGGVLTAEAFGALAPRQVPDLSAKRGRPGDFDGALLPAVSAAPLRNTEHFAVESFAASTGSVGHAYGNALVKS
ncbi:hypothetical protein MO973_16180 [Paenibacillus sp. TRM 82003]|uniref:hypothetical protein n=1 Tax=Kineococcus sp. TRM81007 TaxID=2925831 RepID=UPI001F5A1CED|nr:hypothetical protein [Kineococcus sp. TRM81007]MCI2237751.1 hypothetical protein [Kineococcus sp. TRM81007]MCI3921769.1 hypothetical protein [Paenibacillus sp. TRM 82003]